MKTHVFRLHPGDDLRQSLDAYVQRHQVKAAVILSCVGSLSQLRLRDASGVNVRTLNEECEIVSATGTIGVDRIHIHLSCSLENLSTIGGHLMDGCLIKTTAEVVLLELDHLRFGKVFDVHTGYNELDIIRE